MFRRHRAESVPENRPPVDDGTGGAQAARERIIGIARVPDGPDEYQPVDCREPLLTRGQRVRAEIGVEE